MRSDAGMQYQRRSDREIELAIARAVIRSSSQPCPEAIDLGVAKPALPVPDGNLDELKPLLGSAEQEIKVAKRIKIAEVRTAVRNPLVALT